MSPGPNPPFPDRRFTEPQPPPAESTAPCEVRRRSLTDSYVEGQKTKIVSIGSFGNLSKLKKPPGPCRAFALTSPGSDEDEGTVRRGDGATTQVTHPHEQAAMLCAAASSGDDITLESLLQMGYHVDKGDYDHRTALHLAAEEGHLECVKMLVRSGADINCRDRWGTTPLKGAVQNLNNEVANYLRDHGAKIADDSLDGTLYGQQRRGIRIWFDRALQYCGLAPDGEVCPTVGVAGYLYSEHGINVLKHSAMAAELSSLCCTLSSITSHDAGADIKEWLSVKERWNKNTMPSQPSTLRPRIPKKQKRDDDMGIRWSIKSETESSTEFCSPRDSTASDGFDAAAYNIEHDICVSPEMAKRIFAMFGRSVMTLSQLTIACIGNEPSSPGGSSKTKGASVFHSPVPSPPPSVPQGAIKKAALAGSCQVLRNVCLGRLQIANWRGFVESILELAMRVLKMGNEGKNADYIPELSEDKVSPSAFGIGVCTVDGQQLAVGDVGDFTIQSCGKPFVYAQCVEEYGQDHVHAHVGQEPSGRAFNDFALTPKGQPFNAVTNAGAMMTAALYHPEETLQDRSVRYLGRVRRFCGGENVSMDESVLSSELQTAYRNHAIANFMMSEGCYPSQVRTIAELNRHVEFYIRTCAVSMNCQALSNMAASLAHYGECPLTREKVLSFSTVKQTLQLAYSCGMYNSSGEWACTVGIPAKSGVSGAIWLAVPGVLGLCVRSPRLDSNGNSVRGARFSRQFAERFQWGVMDLLYRHKDGKTAV
eukprot:Hpha_TRINITY_DN16964_c1_g2::TRINITY_DN16964_c1_g2_i1::g.55457::m.55457/K01425/glsA, GLS; glutaminase